MRITSLNLNYFIGKWISTAFYKHFLGVCSVLGLGDVNETKASTLHSKSMCSALTDINHSNIFFDPSPGIMEIKTNQKKLDLHKLKNLRSKENSKQNEKTTHRLGENMCK